MFVQKYKNIHPHKDMYNNAHTIGEEEGLGRIRRGKLNSMNSAGDGPRRLSQVSLSDREAKREGELM